MHEIYKKILVTNTNPISFQETIIEYITIHHDFSKFNTNARSIYYHTIVKQSPHM
jgi:hypothetical protein